MPDWITVARNFDLESLRKLATDPRIWPHISDDHFPDPEKWKPILGELAIVLVACDRKGYFGFAIFLPRTFTTWDCHFGFLPRAGVWKAMKAMKKFFRWMWEHTEAERIVGDIASDNTQALAFARRAGCSAYGLNPKSVKRGGVLLDQVCVGISRP